MARAREGLEAQRKERADKKAAFDARVEALHAVAMKLATAHVVKIKAGVDAALVAELEAV